MTGQEEAGDVIGVLEVEEVTGLDEAGDVMGMLVPSESVDACADEAPIYAADAEMYSFTSGKLWLVHSACTQQDLHCASRTNRYCSIRKQRKGLSDGRNCCV